MDTKDKVFFKIQSHGNGSIWNWQINLENTPNRENGSIADKTKLQSTFFGKLFLKETLRKLDLNCKSQLNNWGKIYLFALNLMDGTLELDEISQRLYSQFPDQFSGKEEALTLIREMVQLFGM